MPLSSRIETHVGDLLAVPRGILVHGCNARGLMGAGIARAVRDRYPPAYRAYRERYAQTGLVLGTIVPVLLEGTDEQPVRILVHAITQEDVGTHRVQVDYPAVGRCFEAIGTLARQTGLDVHFPRIGCGLAGGSWDRVAPLIEEGLAGVPAHLWTLSP